MSIVRNGITDTDLDIPVISPTLSLDFANSQSLDPRITFTRGSTGTRVNKNGLIEVVEVNQPRFDYDPISGECKGLLIEESRSNLFLYSQKHDVAGTWGNQTSTSIINTSETLAPDGTNTATKLIGTIGVRTRQSVYQTISVTSGVTYTFSVFLKAAERRYVCIWFDNFNVSQGAYYGASNYIDLSKGTIPYEGTPGGTKIVPYPNGWYRIYVTATPTITGSFTFNTSIGTPNNYADTGIANTYKYTGDGTSGIYIYGAQVEAGAFPTSYIPTTASTVTRSADNASMTGTNFSSWYNQSEGTFFFDGSLPFISNDVNNTGGTSRVPFGVSNGLNFPNSIYVSKNLSSLGLSFNVFSNGVSQTQGATSLPPMSSSNFKIAASVAPRNIYSCGYGGVVYKTSRPVATIPTVDRLSLGKEPWNAGATNPMIGCIRKFAYYPRALSPSQLQYLTQ